jgi:transcriptional regulator with XRE-family HTH domain
MTEHRTRHRVTAGPVINGPALMAARRKAGYNRARAAAALGVSESAVARYEQGKIDPSAAALLMMAFLYRTSVERLCRPRAEVLAEAAATIAAATAAELVTA